MAATPPSPSSHLQPASAAPPPSSDRPGWRETLGFAVGGLHYNHGVDGIKQLAQPIFNIMLGVNPALIGTILMSARIWDAFTDPWMGLISDNTRTRWGRRRPYILLGAVLSAIIFPLIWFVPRGASPQFAATYFGVMAFLFYTAFTIYCVPFVTLALEMTPSYSERTRILAIRTFFSSLSGLTLSWAFRIAYWEGFGDPVNGIRVVGLCIGALFLLAGASPAIFVRERYMKLAQNQKKLSFKVSLKTTLQNRQFLVLIGLTLSIIFGAMTFGALGIYVNTYYVFGGDVAKGATMMGLMGTAGLLANWAYLPIITIMARKYGKTRALAFCLICGLVGSVGKWFLIRPEWPYAQLLLPIILSPAHSAFWLLVNSMKADVCDYDEMQSGVRREGAYAAVSSWAQKFAAAMTFSMSGFVLVAVGFEQNLGGNQSPHALDLLRASYAAMPLVSYGVALLLLRRYRLGPQEMADIRAKLEARRATV